MSCVCVCVCVCSAEDNNVPVLLPLAREYQIDDLTNRCEQFLLCREPSVRSLVLAEEFSLETLEKQCLDYVNRSLLHCLQCVKPVLSSPPASIFLLPFLCLPHFPISTSLSLPARYTLLTVTEPNSWVLILFGLTGLPKVRSLYIPTILCRTPIEGSRQLKTGSKSRRPCPTRLSNSVPN